MLHHLIVNNKFGSLLSSFIGSFALCDQNLMRSGNEVKFFILVISIVLMYHNMLVSELLVMMNTERVVFTR